jgi:hypothetical protein
MLLQVALLYGVLRFSLSLVLCSLCLYTEGLGLRAWGVGPRASVVIYQRVLLCL